MEKQVTVDRSSDSEMLSDIDNNKTQIPHLETHRPVPLLLAADQGATVSMDRVTRPAPRTTLPDPENATCLQEMEAFYNSAQLGNLDTHFGQVGIDGGTKSKDLLCSPTHMLARPPPHRFRLKDEAPLDSTTSRFACVQCDTDIHTTGFDGSQRTHTAVDFSSHPATDANATTGAVQRGQGQVHIPTQAPTGDSLVVSDQNVKPVNSDFVQYLPDIFSVGNYSQDDMHGHLRRSRSFYVEGVLDKKAIDEVVNKNVCTTLRPTTGG